MENTDILSEIVSVSQRPGFGTSPEKRRAISNMQSCRTIDRGGRIMYCPECATTSVLYNPCNQRGCPTCYQKNQILWKLKLQRKILPVSHEHIIFSFPQAITKLWLVNKEKIINALFKTVSAAIKKLQEKTGLIYGCVLVFQSHGRGMCYKPHIHCLLSSGGISITGNVKWIAEGSVPFSTLEDSVQEGILYELRKSIPELDTQIVVNEFKQNECKVYHAHHSGTGNNIVEYLSHSLAGVVIDMNQSFRINEEKDLISFKEHHQGETIETTLSRPIFVERYLSHIPPSACVTIRYYGLYSNGYADELAEIKKNMKPVDPTDKLAIEIGDICPICNSPLMVLQSFQTGHKGGILVSMISRSPPAHGALLSKA